MIVHLLFVCWFIGAVVDLSGTIFFKHKLSASDIAFGLTIGAVMGFPMALEYVYVSIKHRILKGTT